jgi:hypothetical protein
MPDKTVCIQNRKGYICFIGEDGPFLLYDPVVFTNVTGKRKRKG